VIGSDERELLRALESARAEPHGTVTLREQSRDAEGVVVTCAVTLPGSHPLADVTLAVVEDGLVSKVERGENAGRTLHHSAVVRRIVDLGTAQGGSFSAKPRVALDRAWRPEALRLVAFVQERQTGHVLAAASAPVAQVPSATFHSH
jgi:hypothetical protein